MEGSKTLDPWIDPSTVGVRSLHLEPLVRWIGDEWPAGRPFRLLDFGCGDLLLARLLPSGISVDGFDLDPSTRAAARSAAAPETTVFAAVDEIPSDVYDAVVASSVLQYLEGQEALGRWMGRVASWLRPGATGGVVATDLPVSGGGRVIDAWDLIVHLWPRVGPWATVCDLGRLARRSPGLGLRVDEAELVGDAAAVGLTARRLPDNLSPLSRRATYVFSP